jgi:hypothetical protein
LPKEEKVLRKGLIFHSKYPFLAIHAKGAESISPKQKDRTTTLFSKKEFFKLVSYYIQKGGESSTFKN